MDVQHLTNIAIKAALAAGEIIQKAIHEDVIVVHKEGGNTIASQVVTKVDLACEQTILKHLKPTCKRFDIGLLSEESKDDGSRFKKDFFWCIDPLDGTLSFINKYPGFSVAIALVDKNGIAQIGVVYDPSTKNLYTAIKNKGAFKNGQPWKVTSNNQYLTYVTDKKLSETPNKTKILALLDDKISFLKLSNFKEIAGAGAVLNAILVVENTPALFLKLPKKEKGGGSLWDFAATSCIFNELGLRASTFNGSELNLNPKETTFMNTEGIYFST